MKNINHIFAHPRIRLVFWLTFTLLLLFSVTPRGYAQAPLAAEDEPTSFPYTKDFVISAYYAPLPGQQYYITGSYEGDIALNGDFYTADGTRVYAGLMAAPKRFPFGTKMNLPGFGVVAVHDRGGAIKGNRLDVWAGEGETGLRRALGWGLRTVSVTVYGLDESIKESVDFATLPLAENIGILARTKYFKNDLSYGTEGEEVKKMQTFLKKLGYFNGEATGLYEAETTAAIQAFQLGEKVIDAATDTGAGNFGPRTRVALEGALEVKKAAIIATTIPSGSLEPGTQGEEVKKLTAALTKYGFLSGEKDTYDDAVRDSLIRFQIDSGIVSSAQDFGAGTFGPRTKEALSTLVSGEYTPSISSTIVIDSPAPVAVVTPSVEVEPEPVPAIESSSPIPTVVFANELTLNSTGPDVTRLQEELQRLHFFGLETTGYFGKTTEHAVFKFQQAVGLVGTEISPGAGIVGPKTAGKLHELIALRESQTQAIAAATDQRAVVVERIEGEKILLASAVDIENFPNDLTHGSRGAEVEQLQQTLKRLGFFPGRFTTEYFGDITLASLKAFQKSHGLEESGVFDLRTRRLINELVGEA